VVLLVALAIAISSLAAAEPGRTPHNAAAPSTPRTLQVTTARLDRGWVIQAASDTSRDAAMRTARQHARDGYRSGVLRSDEYRPFKAGYWVTYLGPWPATKQGQRQAQAVLKTFRRAHPDCKLQRISRR
jgi:hypothetical protein